MTLIHFINQLEKSKTMANKMYYTFHNPSKPSILHLKLMVFDYDSEFDDMKDWKIDFNLNRKTNALLSD